MESRDELGLTFLKRLFIILDIAISFLISLNILDFSYAKSTVNSIYIHFNQHRASE